MSKVMSLKSRIKSYAQRKSLTAQVVLQNYMFECFLNRLSKSKYCDNFIVKGGLLISALVGLDTRATMDLDTTLRYRVLSEKVLEELINEICSLDLDDGVNFRIVSFSRIRDNDVYGGFCVRVDALYETIITPLSIDVTTGDVITPDPVRYEFTGLFDHNIKIPLWGYNVETVLAEKVETILSRGIFSTRPRDFYDIYILSAARTFSIITFRQALDATTKHRNSKKVIDDCEKIIQSISDSPVLNNEWKKYQEKFDYAKEITFEETIVALRELMKRNE